MAQKIAIIGAGPVGALCGCLLAQRGIEVTIFDKRPDPATNNHYSGRSINLALSYRGLQALKLVELDQKALDLSTPMAGRMIHHLDSSLDLQPYSSKGLCINSIPRKEINRIIVERAQALGVRFFFEHKFLEFNNSTITFEVEEAEKRYTYDILIGADGLFSGVRKFLEKKGLVSANTTSISHGYKEMELDMSKATPLNWNALHIWPRKDFMFIALPNQNNTFTGTLFLRMEGVNSFEELNGPTVINQFFEINFPDLIPYVTPVEKTFSASPTSSLQYIDCLPWHADNTLLIGDSSHGIVPFYGQGMNAGLEDCLVLIQRLEEHNFNWKDAFREFSLMRKKDADAISQLALNNFIEMRDGVIDQEYLKLKQLEKEIQATSPDWTPLYDLVSFSDIPYSDALKIGAMQKEYLKENLHVPVEKLDLDYHFQALKRQGLYPLKGKLQSL